MSTDTQNPTPDPDKSKGDQPRGFSLPSADTVKTGLEASGATPAQIETLLWFLHHGRQLKLSQSDLAKLIKRDGSTLGRLFAGKYPAAIEPHLEAIEQYRSVFNERLGLGEKPICETRLMKDVATFCDLARVTATIGLIWGENQSGKTTALETYAERNNHGATVFVRMPVGGAARMFLLALARACGISERNSYDQLRDRIIRHFNSSMLLIVDEVHQAINGRSVKTVTIELIRELADLAQCGVVICGTSVLPEILEDAKLSKFFGQLGNRGILRMKVPGRPRKADVRLVCAAYGLGEPEGEAAELVTEICHRNGLGKLCKYLQMSRRLASKRQQKLAWEHFLATHATMQQWASGQAEEEGGAK